MLSERLSVPPDVVEAAEQIVEQVSLRDRWMEVILWAYIGFAVGYLLGRHLSRRAVQTGFAELLDRL
jgi:hypothetical protein